MAFGCQCSFGVRLEVRSATGLWEFVIHTDLWMEKPLWMKRCLLNTLLFFGVFLFNTENYINHGPERAWAPGPGSHSCRDIFTLENLICAFSGRRACSNWTSGIFNFTLLRPLLACGQRTVGNGQTLRINLIFSFSLRYAECTE